MNELNINYGGVLTADLDELLFLVLNGPPGVSPTVTIEDIEGGHRITIVDVNGSHSFDVLNGATPEQIAAAIALYFEEHPIVETDPTVPAWAKQPTKPTYTASEVGALPANTPIPAEVTEQTVSGWGFTKNTGTYSKPSGGIPKSDLASDVQTSLGKADTALQQHQSLSGYATETWVGQQIAAIPDELPSVSASDNGKVLGVVNGAWAAKTDEGGGSAPFEIPVTQSGSTYSTTATAADILANAENCFISLQGTNVFPDSIVRSASNVVGITANILTTHVNTASIGIAAIFVVVNNGTVTVTVEPIEAQLLPDVTAADNGKFLRVANGAWAAATVPSAESNSFGGSA